MDGHRGGHDEHPRAPKLRHDLVRVDVDGEILLLDRSSASVVRLDAAATSALAEGGGQHQSLMDALDDLRLLEEPRRHVSRRLALRGASLAGLGISVMALPMSAAAVSIDTAGETDEFALATGAVSSFNPSSNSTVRAIALQDDGAIIIGGNFTLVSGNSRHRIARIEANGAVDQNFNPSASATVKALAIQSDGRILLGGDFTTVGGETRNRLARLHANGSLDQLSVNLTANLNALALQQVGDEERIVIGGAFLNIGTTQVKRLARIRPNGDLDANWVNIGSPTSVDALVVDPLNGVIVGGSFQFFFTEGNVNLPNIAGIVRVGPDDRFDTTFPSLIPNGAGTGSAVSSLAVDDQGRILLGGPFQTTFSTGSEHKFIARLNNNHTVDNTFAPNLNGNVEAIAIQSDGRAIIGGLFTSVDGQTRNRVARLHSDTAGTSFLDLSFDPNAGGTVRALAVQANGRIVLGGDFTTVGGQTRSRVARLD